MELNEFDKKYYFHDSLIDEIIYDKENKKLTIVFDFCFWMQQNFKDGEKENGLLKVEFDGVESYDGLVGGHMSDWWSVVVGEIKDGKYHLLIEDIENDINNPEYHDICIDAKNVRVEDLR